MRSVAHVVDCRRCGAPVGSSCVSSSGKSVKAHAIRWADAERGDVEPETLAPVISLDEARTLRRARANGYTGS